MRYDQKYSPSIPVVVLSLSFGLMMMPKIATAEPRQVFGDLSGATISAKIGNPITPLKFESKENGLPHSSTGGATRFAEQINFQPPADQGAPQQSVGGSTRGGQGGVCPQDRNAGFSQQTLRAVLPQSKQGLTGSSHPTFLLYVPQTSASEVEFVLQDESNSQQVREIYQTKFALPQELTAKGGLVTVKMPENLPELEIGKTYTYYATLICSPGDSGGVNYDQGFVTRVAVPAKIAQIQANQTLSLPQSLWQQTLVYAESGIWLDTVSSLLSLMESEPNNPVLQSHWLSLMASVGLNLDETIAKAKILHLLDQQ